MGPLSNVKVLEFAGLGPAPFCGMLLADLGADIVRIDRISGTKPGFEMDPKTDILNRGRRSIGLDLKKPEAIETALRLAETSDVLIEGFRPGVMERLGVGPDVCLARNPRLVYGRMTGWGQSGPLADAVGHDINYIALSGALDLIGRKGERPMFPINLLGDMGGGGLFLAFGIACAVIEARASGRGQVVDAAMVDGAAVQLSGVLAMRASGFWKDVRGSNAVDSGSHMYDVYETKDGRFLAVGAIEPPFYKALRAGAGLVDPIWDRQMDEASWPVLKEKLADVFRTKTQAEWVAVFEGTDACVTPVLSLNEAARHPHNEARGTYIERDGIMQTAPVPRFSRTPGAIRRPPPVPGQHSREVLASRGFSAAEIDALFASGAAAGT